VSRDLQLCELHAHSTWSDGVLSIRELVDLYGRLGFDVLCITDHITIGSPGTPAIQPARWHLYVHEIDREAQRALRTYGLLLVPGVELTGNTDRPDTSAHALALGVRTPPHTEAGLLDAIHAARAQGAAIVAAHPYGLDDRASKRPTRRFALQVELFRPLIHRWELFNRGEVFSWVADARLPAVAAGDVHRPEHVPSWKTLLPCAHDESSILDFLRSRRPALLTPYDPADAGRERAAA
jgi:predicted metal-dependent phosphoesterase TrpH